MSTPLTPAQIATQLEIQKQRVAEASQKREESRARVPTPTHQRAPSNASSASKPESIPEDVTKRAADVAGRRASGASPPSGVGRTASSRTAPATVAAGGDAPESSSEEEEETIAPGRGANIRQTASSSQAPPTGARPQTQTRGAEGTPRTTRTPEGNDEAIRAQIGQLPADLTDDQKSLLMELAEINGQDSYDSLAAGIGKLKRDEYLVLPLGLALPTVPAGYVGKPRAHRHLDINHWAAIYALNKAACPAGADAPRFALLRLEAVKAGWYDGQREVVFREVPDGALLTLATDMATLRDQAAVLKTAAFLVPLVAEHVFRTMGHHFISTDAANYSARYSDTFRSCLMPDIPGILPPSVLYHSALHWVSPARSRAVLMAQLGQTQIPDALAIRANAAPAGTAILTTTTAILEAMAAVNLDKLFAQHGGFNVDGMRMVTAVVKSDPCKYHKAYFAYGVAAPQAHELETLEQMKAEAIKFAPFSQAFIEVYMRDAALGRAKALEKHAHGNPIQKKRAMTLFRAISRAPVKSVEDLFKTHLARGAIDDE